MRINPNLYNGPSSLRLDPAPGSVALYIGDLTKLTPGKTYTFSCDFKQINGASKAMRPIAHIAQGHNKLFKSYGRYYLANVSSGRLVFTFDYIAEANSLMSYTEHSANSQNIGAIWSRIKIEEGGDDTLYIPNKESLEYSKQAVFKAGGYTQKYILSNGFKGLAYVS